MTCHPGFRRQVGLLAPPRAAFTLIEIMVVVGILGMVLALGVPPFVRSMQKDPLRQAVSDVTEACSDARAKAILLGVPTELVIRAEDKQLTVAPAPDTSSVSTGGGGESGGQPAAGAVAKSPMFSARLQEDIAITLLYVNLKDQMEADEARVHFYPNGTSDEFTIVLQHERGVRKISLECVTGRASLEVIR